jgi:hypothetical protein
LRVGNAWCIRTTVSAIFSKLSFFVVPFLTGPPCNVSLVR